MRYHVSPHSSLLRQTRGFIQGWAWAVEFSQGESESPQRRKLRLYMDPCSDKPAIHKSKCCTFSLDINNPTRNPSFGLYAGTLCCVISCWILLGNVSAQDARQQLFVVFCQIWPLFVWRDVGYQANAQHSLLMPPFKRLANIMLCPRTDSLNWIYSPLIGVSESGINAPLYVFEWTSKKRVCV